jgi:hypothetical protein
MAIYEITGPDGRNYMIEGPEGASREEIIDAIESKGATRETPLIPPETEDPEANLQTNRFGLTPQEESLLQAYQDVADADRTAFGRGLSSGADVLQQFYGSTVEGAGKKLGVRGLEEYGADVALANEAQQQRAANNLLSWDDVDGVDSFLTYLGEIAGQSAPITGASLAGSAVGTLAGPAGTIAGGLAPTIPFFYGAGRERQISRAGGDRRNVNELAALSAAVPAALAEVIVNRMLFGGKFWTPKALQGGGVFTKKTVGRVGLGAGQGAGAESITEIGQVALERAQAGLSLTSDDAIAEFVDAGRAGGLLGGVIGGPTGGVRGKTSEADIAERNKAKLESQEAEIKRIQDEVEADRLKTAQETEALEFEEAQKFEKESQEAMLNQTGDLFDTPSEPASELERIQEIVNESGPGALSDEEYEIYQRGKREEDVPYENLTDEEQFVRDAEEEIARRERMQDVQRSRPDVEGTGGVGVPDSGPEVIPRDETTSAERPATPDESELVGASLEIEPVDDAESGVDDPLKAIKEKYKGSKLEKYSDEATNDIKNGKIIPFGRNSEGKIKAIKENVSPEAAKAYSETFNAESQKILNERLKRKKGKTGDLFDSSRPPVQEEVQGETRKVGSPIEERDYLATLETGERVATKLVKYPQKTTQEPVKKKKTKQVETKKSTFKPKTEEQLGFTKAKEVADTLRLPAKSTVKTPKKLKPVPQSQFDSLNNALDKDEISKSEYNKINKDLLSKQSAYREQEENMLAEKDQRGRLLAQVKKLRFVFAPYMGVKGKTEEEQERLKQLDSSLQLEFQRNAEKNNIERSAVRKELAAGEAVKNSKTDGERDRNLGDFEKIVSENNNNLRIVFDEDPSTELDKQIFYDIIKRNPANYKDGIVLPAKSKKARSDESALAIYLSKLPRPIDAIYLILYDYHASVDNYRGDPKPELAKGTAKTFAELSPIDKPMTRSGQEVEFDAIKSEEESFSSGLGKLNARKALNYLKKRGKFSTELNVWMQDTELLMEGQATQFFDILTPDQVNTEEFTKIRRVQTAANVLNQDLVLSNSQEQQELIQTRETVQNALDTANITLPDTSAISGPSETKVGTGLRKPPIRKRTSESKADREAKVDDIVDNIYEILNISRDQQGQGELDLDGTGERKELSADSVLHTTRELPHRVVRHIKEGNLELALRQFYTQVKSPRLANLLKSYISLIGTTKIQMVNSLTSDVTGKPLAGRFDPKTNTIEIDPVRGINNHTLLHEMGHAVLSANLANPKNISAVQIKNIFNEVKGMLGTDYGSADVDEFTAEVLSNPAFRHELASIRLPKDMDSGKDITALRRTLNVIKNFFRRLLGLQSTPLDTIDTLSAVDNLIETIMAPAPEHRHAGSLELTASGVQQKLNNLANVKNTVSKTSIEKAANTTIDFLKNNVVTNAAKNLLLSVKDGQQLGDVTKRVFGSDFGYRVQDLLNSRRGSIFRGTNNVDVQINRMNEWKKRPEVRKVKGMDLLNDYVYNPNYGATVYDVDGMNRPRSYYAGKFDDSGNSLEDVWVQQNKSLVPQLKKIGGDKLRNDNATFYRNLFAEVRRLLGFQADELLAGNPKAISGLKKLINDELDNKGMDVYEPFIRPPGSYHLYYVNKGEPTYLNFSTTRDRNDFVDMLNEDVKNKKGEFKDVDLTTIDEINDELTLKHFENAPSSSFTGQLLKYISDANLDKDVESELKVQISRLFVQLLPETSLYKSLQTRKGTLGYIKDVQSAMQVRGYQMARQVALFKHNTEIKKLREELKEEVKKARARNIRKPANIKEALQGIKDAPFKTIRDLPTTLFKGGDPSIDLVAAELADRLSFAVTGSKSVLDPYARDANQLAFLYTIGTAPSSAVVQSSQIPLVVAPYLGAEYGYNNTRKYLQKSYSTVLGFTSLENLKGAKKAGAINTLLNYFEPDTTILLDEGTERIPRLKLKKGLGLAPETEAALKELIPIIQRSADLGQTQTSYHKDTMGLNDLGTLFGQSKPRQISNWVSSYAAAMFNHTDRNNRQVSQVAIYRMELARLKGELTSELKPLTAEEKKMSGQEKINSAVDFAMRKAQELNTGSYLETGASIGRQGIGRVAFMYKGYGASMNYLLIKTLRNLVNAEADPVARKIARRQLLGVFGSATFFAGVRGVPFIGAFTLLADLFLYDDEEDDAETVIRKYIGEFAFKGPVNAFTGLNIGDRIRLSGLLFQRNKFNADASIEENILHYAGGPAWSTFRRLQRGVNDLGEGRYIRAIESFVPAGISSMFRAFPLIGRYYREGEIRTRRGDPMYIFDSNAPFFYAAQFMGFPPAEYIREMEISNRQKLMDISTSKRKSRLTKKYYVAKRFNDFEEMRAIRKEMAEFNKDHPLSPITEKTIKQSMKRHDKITKDMINGVLISSTMREELGINRREYDVGFQLIE